MKRVIASVLLAILVGAPLLADDTDTIIKDLMQSQGVDRIENLNGEAVSDQQLAELGEALMDEMVPNQRQHDFMDRMMGGKGSQSLTAMHQAMGYEYVAEDGDANWRSRRGGRGMMGVPWMMGSWGGHMWSGGAIIFWSIILILLAAVVVLAILLARRIRSAK